MAKNRVWSTKRDRERAKRKKREDKAKRREERKRLEGEEPGEESQLSEEERPGDEGAVGTEGSENEETPRPNLDQGGVEETEIASELSTEGEDHAAPSARNDE